MKLLIYKIKLAFHLSIFILRLSANFSNKTKPIILGLFITGLLVLISGISLLTNSQKIEENVVVTLIIPQHEQLFNVKNLTKEDLELELIFWEKVLKTQPKSRDVLLNISRIYSALTLEEKALEYKNEALSIDPNNPLFE